MNISDTMKKKKGLTRSKTSDRAFSDTAGGSLSKVATAKGSGPNPLTDQRLQHAGAGEPRDELGRADNGPVDFHNSALSSAKDVTKFQARLRKGKVRLCPGCGEIMSKSSRMVLSPLAGLILVIFGTLHMVVYGLATNFLQAPWFLKFVLPSVYYIGSIFIGIGVLFFFIRERVWRCRGCGEIGKR